MTEIGQEGYERDFGAEEDASEAVLDAIAAVTNRPLLELPPLQESIDVDSLDCLFDASKTVHSLRFEYAGYEVLLEPDRVRVRKTT